MGDEHAKVSKAHLLNKASMEVLLEAEMIAAQTFMARRLLIDQLAVAAIIMDLTIEGTHELNATNGWDPDPSG